MCKKANKTKLLEVVIKPCVMCNAPAVLKRWGADPFCHNCLIDDGFLKCSTCNKYVESDLVLEANGEYLDALVNYELENEFICEGCAEYKGSELYNLSGDDLLKKLGVETCTDPFEYYGLERNMF